MTDIRWDILRPVDVPGALQTGFDHARQVRQQNALTGYQQEQMATARESRQTAVRAGKQIAAGDLAGAGREAAASGDLDLMRTINGLSQEQRQQAAARSAAMGPLYVQARRLPYEQRRAFIASVAPRLAEMGVAPDMIAGYDPTDQRLDADIAAGMTMAQALDQGQVHWQAVGPGGAFATDGQGRPLATGDPRLTGGTSSPAAAPAGTPSAGEGPGANLRSFDPAHPAAAPSPAVDALYSEFRNLGWTDEGARTMVAQIGRENGYSPNLMFGSHTDHNNGATNAGIVSWQGDRRPAFMQFMTERGFVQDGHIVPSEEALRAQAQFADQEMRQRYPQSAAAVRDPNGNYQSIEPVLSNNYFGWDRAGHHIDAQSHLARMGNYYQATAGLGDQRPSPMQTASAGPAPQPGGVGSLQDQARTGVVQAPRQMPQGFEPDPDTGGIRPMRGSQAEWERRHTAGSDARQQSNVNTDNTRQNMQMVNQTRQEFNQLPEVRDFQASRSAVRQIERLVNSVPQGAPGRAQADMALIFSYMRALDPGNAVREGEYATAGNAASVPERIRIQYNKAIDGDQLSPVQRHGMAGAAYQTYLARATVYNERARQYHQYFRDMGVQEPGRYAPLATGPMTEERRRQAAPAQGQTSHGVHWRVVH